MSSRDGAQWQLQRSSREVGFVMDLSGRKLRTRALADALANLSRVLHDEDLRARAAQREFVCVLFFQLSLRPVGEFLRKTRARRTLARR